MTARFGAFASSSGENVPALHRHRRCGRVVNGRYLSDHPASGERIDRDVTTDVTRFRILPPMQLILLPGEDTMERWRSTAAVVLVVAAVAVGGCAGSMAGDDKMMGDKKRMEEKKMMEKKDGQMMDKK